jgi:Exopolysaccharide biosynthesis protein related to N-acetylglucosamine-1-phosphodiester alpha-N-acetylglucosaminidase
MDRDDDTRRERETDREATPADARGRRWTRKKTRRALLAGGLAALLAVGGTSAWALDRFVIEHVEVTNASALESSTTSASDSSTSTDDSASTTSSESGTTEDSGSTSGTTTTATSYESADTSVTISTVTTGSGSDTVTYYVADIQLSDATDLRSAFADDSFGENITEKTSEIASDNGAILAINGDYYGFRDTGIVIRNGVVYRDEGARQGLALYRDGSVKVYDETATDAQTLVDEGVWNTLSFGPALVEDGAIVEGIDSVEIDTNFGNHSIQGEQPRTAIGVIDENHLVLVVVDGRSEGYSRGVTMTELAQIMEDLGATTAYNLDGGGSSTLWFNGEVVNQPSNGGERATSDILYIRAGS